MSIKVSRNNFENLEIVNLSQDYKSDSLLQENHGVVYVWCNSEFFKLGELSEVTNKTPCEAFNDSYSSGRDRGVIYVLKIIIFDKNIVREHFPIDHRGFDKEIHKQINMYHSSNDVDTPFFIDTQKEFYSNEEALVNFNDSPNHWGRLLTIIKSVLDPKNLKTHKLSLAAEIVPKEYQEPTLNLVIECLIKHGVALLHAFPGWGKSTMGLYAMVKLAHTAGDINDDAPLNILVVSPIVDTLEGFIESAHTMNYFNQKINVYTTDDVAFYADQHKGALLQRINDSKGEINLFVFSVQGVRYANPEDSENQVTDRTINDRYKFLSEIDIYGQIRDERHTEYNGSITTQVFDKIRSKYTLDLTATPYNLQQSGVYKEEHLVTDSMLNALSKKKSGNPAYQKFPDISIMSYTPSVMVQNSPEFSKIYTEEEDWDPRKLFEINDGEFIHRQCFTDILDAQIGQKAKLSFKKNPFSILNDPGISGVATDIIMVILPQGTNDHNAKNNCEIAVQTCSQDQRFEDSVFVTSYDLTINRSVKPYKAIKKLKTANPGKRIVIFTHRKMTTGSDVPPMGAIIMYDKMSNPGEFEQLLGRIFRDFQGKSKVRLYNLCPNMALAHHVYHIAKDAVARGETQKSESELYDCLPLTLVSDVDRKVISYEDAYRGVLEETRKIASGNGFTRNYFNGFPELTSILVGMPFSPLKNGAKGTAISGKNRSKVKSVTRKPGEKETPTEKKSRRSWQETMTCMLNEIPMVGYTTEANTVQDVFATELAKMLFTEDNCALMHSALNGSHDFRNALEIKYQEIMQDLNELGIPELLGRIFRNEEYKKSHSLVYMPEYLSRELLDNRNLRRLYKKKISKGQDFTILIPNALSGMLPIIARELYPEAKITCAEYFPYYCGHLVALGFNVIDLNMDIENFKMKKKFDVVVGNPPYVDASGGNIPLYNKFVEKCHGLSDRVSLIIPSSCAISDERHGDVVRHAIFNEYTQEIRFLPKETFENADVNTLSYYIDRTKSRTSVTVVDENGESHSVNSLDTYIWKDPVLRAILKKCGTVNNTESHYKFTRMENLKDDGPVIRTVTCSNRHGITYEDTTLVDKTIGKHRVVTSFFQDPDFRHYLTYPIGPDVAVKPGYTVCSCKNRTEAENIAQFFKSKLFLYIWKMTSTSRTLRTPQLKFVPWMDFKQSWSDEELYTHFNLSKKEIAAIENKIEN